MVAANNKKKVYEFFNPNPNYKDFKDGRHKRCTTTDCAIRAVAGCLNVDWYQALDLLTESAKKVCDAPESIEAIDDALKRKGFTKMSIKIEKGSKRPTAESFAREHQDGVYLLSLAAHVVCVKNGKYYDAWDCGNKSVYSYYKKIA